VYSIKENIHAYMFNFLDLLFYKNFVYLYECFLVFSQSTEFSKLVGLLKPEESEDVILSACQKLISFFIQRPEQKHVFMSQHGFLPLMELLDVPRNRVCVLSLDTVIL